SIGLAGSFTILPVTANTMSMAVRERRTEIAVLKTLGFSSLQVMGLIVAEAIVLGALGGGLGLGGSQGLMWFLTHTPGVKDMLAGIGLSELHLKPMIAALGFAVALGLGFAAGFRPELHPWIPIEHRNLIVVREEIARAADRQPLASPEDVVVTMKPKKDGVPTNISVRGVTPRAFEVRSGIKIVQGRAFTPGLYEVIVGDKIARRVQGLDLGSSVRLQKH